MRSERCFLISAVVSALPFCARWFVQKHIMCLSVSSFLICLSVMRLHWWHSADSTMPHFLRKNLVALFPCMWAIIFFLSAMVVFFTVFLIYLQLISSVFTPQ